MESNSNLLDFYFFNQRRAEGDAQENWYLDLVGTILPSSGVSLLFPPTPQCSFSPKVRGGIEWRIHWGSKSKVTGASVSPLQLTGDRLIIARDLLYCRAITIATQEMQVWISCGSHICQGGEGLSTQESVAIVQMCAKYPGSETSWTPVSSGSPSSWLFFWTSPALTPQVLE